VSLDPRGTYLVTGGLGALGLHVASWAIAKGARRLVLTTRRQATDPTVDAAIGRLRDSGAEVIVSTSDVARAGDVDALLRRIAAGPAPLKGVIHAAGVDTMIPLRRMTPRDIDAVMAPKATGAWLLHDRTQGLDLDLFICFSSMASVTGAQGRAHYSAANAFLDALALERQRSGQPALSVNWGPWRGGGMASSEQLEQFERIGNFGLDPHAALTVLDRLVASRVAQAMVADVDWIRFREAYEAQMARPLVSAFRNEAPRRPRVGAAQVAVRPAPTAPSNPVPDLPWISALIEVAESDRQTKLASLLRAEAAATLGFDRPEDVPLDRPFSTLGMDSLMIADFIGRLKKRAGASCSALVFEHPEVRLLAPRLLEALAPAFAAASGHSSARTPHDASQTTPVDGSAAARDGAIHGYSADGESEVFAFQAHAFPQRRSALIAPRWRWMFVDSARRLGLEPRVWLARDEQRIVGHMGTIPVRLKLGPEERETGWLVETMVLQSHRDRAVGSRLMVQAHDDFPFALSLGQTAEMREIQLRLGWKQVAPLQTARLLLRPENVLKGKLPTPVAWAAGLGVRASAAVRDALRDRTRIEVREITRFNSDHDALWDRAARDVGCAVVRDASYLNWKYVDQPGQEFVRLELREGDSLTAVGVLMFRDPDDAYRYRRAFLVDLVVPLSNQRRVAELIQAACATAAERNADALLCLHVGKPLTDALRGCGFNLRAPERYLLVDPGALDAPSRAHVLSADEWFVTHGDSDIDRPW
jgi:NAD(P)-dependent dehydrogenase (short-subunit alcohol dehydrogenase family)